MSLINPEIITIEGLRNTQELSHIIRLQITHNAANTVVTLVLAQFK